MLRSPWVHLVREIFSGKSKKEEEKKMDWFGESVPARNSHVWVVISVQSPS
jgi:hypothetical protein